MVTLMCEDRKHFQKCPFSNGIDIKIIKVNVNCVKCYFVRNKSKKCHKYDNFRKLAIWCNCYTQH